MLLRGILQSTVQPVARHATSFFRHCCKRVGQARSATIRRSLRFVLSLVAGGFAIVCMFSLLQCSDHDVQGSLLVSVSDSDASAICDLASGERRRLEWPRRGFGLVALCKAKADTVIISSCCNLNEPECLVANWEVEYIYKWVPGDTSFVLAATVGGRAYPCQNLDYSPSGDRILYSGAMDTKRGVFLLDSAFRVVDTVLSLGASTSDAPYTIAYFADEDNCVLYRNDSIIICSIAGEEQRRILAGRIEDVCPTGHYAVWAYGVLRRSQFFRLDLSTLESTDLDIPRDACEVSISQDGRYIAYAHDPDIAAWRHISVLDTETGKHHHTHFPSSCTRLLWIR